MVPTFFVPDYPTIRPTTVASYRSSDTSWPAANPCPSLSGPSAVGCRTRNYRSCSSTYHCCCGVRARHPHKLDLFCNSVNIKYNRIRPVEIPVTGIHLILGAIPKLPNIIIIPTNDYIILYTSVALDDD